MIFTNETTSRFLEIADIALLSLVTEMDIVLVDMPEILLRMKVGHNHSLAEL